MGRTFVTLTTPQGQGGIHVLLLGGVEASSILGRTFRVASKRSGGKGSLAFGHIVDGDEVIDEVLVARGGAEDGPVEVFEINGHGGPAPARAVMDLLVRHGARPLSWPRAIKRLDIGSLSPAKWRARVLLPRARTLLSASILAEQVQGALSNALKSLAEALNEVCRGQEDARGRARAWCESLLATKALGTAVRNPPVVMLLGPTNAGKSTLFNAMVGRERVIVDKTPGTTRDRIREAIQVRGVPFILSDSPGLTDRPSDGAEASGVEAGRLSAGRVDLRVFLFDGARHPSEEDFREWEDLAPPRVPLLGKMDLPESRDAGSIAADRLGEKILPVSGLAGKGLSGFRDRVLEVFGIRPPDPGAEAGPVLLGGRCEALVRESREALDAREAPALSRIAKALTRFAKGSP